MNPDTVAAPGVSASILPGTLTLTDAAAAAAIYRRVIADGDDARRISGTNGRLDAS